jgi:hypothetical protein
VAESDNEESSVAVDDKKITRCTQNIRNGDDDGCELGCEEEQPDHDHSSPSDRVHHVDSEGVSCTLSSGWSGWSSPTGRRGDDDDGSLTPGSSCCTEPWPDAVHDSVVRVEWVTSVERVTRDMCSEGVLSAARSLHCVQSSKQCNRAIQHEASRRVVRQHVNSTQRLHLFPGFKARYRRLFSPTTGRAYRIYISIDEQNKQQRVKCSIPRPLFCNASVGCASNDGDDQIAHEGHLDVTGDDEGGVTTPDVDEVQRRGMPR